MVKKSKKEEKKSKKIKTKSAKIKESKQEKKKKNAARKRLHFMAINYDSEKTKTTFSEYLEKKREKEEKINQLVIEAKLDSDSIGSLTNFLEDNDFSEKGSSSDEDEEFEINEKKDKNKKSPKKEEKFDINKPLKGKIIVLSGEMIIPKEYLKVILLNLGAKVTSAISNKTDILIHGETLEDGRKINLGRKYKMAKGKKVKIYLDRDFEKYMGQLINKEWKMRDEAKKVKF